MPSGRHRDVREGSRRSSWTPASRAFRAGLRIDVRRASQPSNKRPRQREKSDATQTKSNCVRGLESPRVEVRKHAVDAELLRSAKSTASRWISDAQHSAPRECSTSGTAAAARSRTRSRCSRRVGARRAEDQAEHPLRRVQAAASATLEILAQPDSADPRKCRSANAAASGSLRVDAA